MAGVTKKAVAVAEPLPAEAPADKPMDKSAIKVSAAEAQSQKTVSPQQLSDNMYKRAVMLSQQGRSKDARAALAESLAASPRNAPARQLLVSLHVEASNLSEASALLREGVKLSPDHSGLWMNLARLQLENADANGATATLEQGLPSASEDGAYHAFYAALMQRAGRHDEAVKHYLAALRIEPGMPNWLVGIGISLQAIGKGQDAAEAFQRAKDGGQLPPAFVAFVDQRLSQLKR
jgi:MSHA biogenesis protein MshN